MVPSGGSDLVYLIEVPSAKEELGSEDVDDVAVFN